MSTAGIISILQTSMAVTSVFVPILPVPSAKTTGDVKNLLHRLILEYLRQGLALNALLSLSLSSKTSRDLFSVFLVSLGIIISST
jgi:hypothetical protein